MSQIFGLLGLFLGLWTAGWIARWVGDLWSGARPAVVFWALSWLVAGLGGLAIATLVGVWGEALGKAVRSGPAGFVDRAGGAVVGVALGMLVTAFVLMVALQFPAAPVIARPVAASKLPAPILGVAADASALSDRVFPGSRWLHERFAIAERRARAANSAG